MTRQHDLNILLLEARNLFEETLKEFMDELADNEPGYEEDEEEEVTEEEGEYARGE
jgi:hypothetical protein